MVMKLEAKDPRLVLKTAPPKVPKNLLVRERLSLRTPALAGKSVIAVQAASGFGKTMLLAQWRRETLESGGIVAWLTLDPWDDDSRFVHGLTIAMQLGSGRPRFGENARAMIDQRNGQHEGLTSWLADVLHLGSEVVLVLDDVHLMPSPAAASSLLYLLHNAPTNLKIILAARRPLSLHVADLLSRGEYVLLDQENLRFRRAESITLLSSRFGVRVDIDSCAKLHELTEGWPLGLQLAIAQVEKSVNVKEAIARSFVHSGDMRRYFVESLIDRLQPRDAEFLVHVSFIDALHPGLCEAITGNTDSANILEHLCDVTPIIGEGLGSEWRRIHPLARDFLRERFEMLSLEVKQSAMQRAVQWLADQKIYEEAARLAFHTGQMELAYDLAEQCLFDILRTGQHFRVAAWAERIPAAALQSRPQLRIVTAWTLALSDRHREAAALVSPILNDPSAGENAHCECAEICASAAFIADDLSQANDIISPWFHFIGTQTELLLLVGLNLRATLALYQGLPERSRYFLEATYTGERDAYAGGWRDWIIGMSYLWEGQMVLAEDALRTSLAQAEQVSGYRSPIAAMLSTTLAAVLWERNKHEEIATLLADRQDVIEHHTAADSIIWGHLTLARLAVESGNERRAIDLLERLFALGETRQLHRLCIASLVEQMRMHALANRRDACRSLTQRLESATTTHAMQCCEMHEPLLCIQRAMAYSHLYAVQQQWGKVLSEVDDILPMVDGLRRGKDRIQLQLLKALALKRSGQEGEILLQEALSMAKMLGLERILQDTHPDLSGWVRQIQGGKPEQPVATARSAPPPAEIAVPTSALLTPKECDVLRLLARNMSNKEIALAMEIGGETVKWHLKNLFDKLYAANRKHLLHRAQMLGLIDTPP